MLVDRIYWYWWRRMFAVVRSTREEVSLESTSPSPPSLKARKESSPGKFIFISCLELCKSLSILTWEIPSLVSVGDLRETFGQKGGEDKDFYL